MTIRSGSLFYGFATTTISKQAIPVAKHFPVHLSSILKASYGNNIDAILTAIGEFARCREHHQERGGFHAVGIYFFRQYLEIFRPLVD